MNAKSIWQRIKKEFHDSRAGRVPVSNLPEQRDESRTNKHNLWIFVGFAAFAVSMVLVALTQSVWPDILFVVFVAVAFKAASDREVAQERRTVHLNTRPKRAGITPEMRRQVWLRDGGKCQRCGSAFDFQYDHIIPLSLGGANTVENLQILCGSCNQRKGKREAWRR